jgi:hypothetical protein
MSVAAAYYTQSYCCTRISEFDDSLVLVHLADVPVAQFSTFDGALCRPLTCFAVVYPSFCLFGVPHLF